MGGGEGQPLDGGGSPCPPTMDTPVLCSLLCRLLFRPVKNGQIIVSHLKLEISINV